MKTDAIRITTPEGEIFELPSYIDPHGVRRYVSNLVIDRAFDEGLIDLNAISCLCVQQGIPVKDRIIFWSMLGYSVDGMCDLGFMGPIIVETPEWTKDAETDEDDQDD